MKSEVLNSELEYHFGENDKEEKEKVEDIKELKRWVARWSKEEAGAA